MQEPILCDYQLKRVKVIDFYSSFIWTTRYFKSGDFEIVIPATNENMSLVKENMYIIREDDENIGEIERIEIKQNEESIQSLIIKGRFVAGSILDRRVISQQTILNSTLKEVILKLLNENIITPIDEDRKILNFVADIPELNQKIDTQYTGQKLLKAIEELCEENKVGFKIIREDSKWVLKLYEGLDRTYNQEENTRCILSDSLENLASSAFAQDRTYIANNIYVAGEGEGKDRVIVNVSKTKQTGMNRKELWLDKRDISSNNQEISSDEYKKILNSIGLANIKENPIEQFNADVYFDTVEYKKDVNVGDIVVIENSLLGTKVNTRLLEIIESIDENGTYKIIPTFDI